MLAGRAWRRTKARLGGGADACTQQWRRRAAHRHSLHTHECNTDPNECYLQWEVGVGRAMLPVGAVALFKKAHHPTRSAAPAALPVTFHCQMSQNERGRRPEEGLSESKPPADSSAQLAQALCGRASVVFCNPMTARND